MGLILKFECKPTIIIDEVRIYFVQLFWRRMFNLGFIFRVAYMLWADRSLAPYYEYWSTPYSRTGAYTTLARFNLISPWVIAIEAHKSQIAEPPER